MFWPQCKGCRLYGNKPVMAQIPETATIAIIGEAPGDVEEAQGIPFVGPSGSLLNKLIAEVGWDRDKDILVANTIMCRPPNNVIKSDEVKNCYPLLEDLLLKHKDQLKVIIPMGNTALGKLMGYGGSKKAGITKHRGRIIETPFGTVIPTFHPAFALRNPENEPVILNDLKLAAAYAEGKYSDPHRRKYEVLTEYMEAVRWLKKLAKAKAFAYDTETTGFDVDDKMVGVSFSNSIGQAIYLPLWVYNEDIGALQRPNMLKYAPFRRRIYGYLRDVFNSRARKAGHNLKFDSQVIFRNLGVWPKNQVFDTMLAAHLLDSEAGGFSLDILTSRFLPDMAGYKSEVGGYVKGSKLEDDFGFGMIPLKILGPYACGDADATLRLANIFRKQIDKKPKMKKLYEELVIPFMEELSKAEMRGISIDMTYLGQTAHKFGMDVKRLRANIEAAGLQHGLEDFNPNSAVQMRQLLYDNMGCGVPQKAVRKYSRGRVTIEYEDKLTPTGLTPTDKRSLVGLVLDKKVSRQNREVIQDILAYNQVKTLNSTYIEGMYSKNHGGVLHPNFLQHGTKTGRLSCAKPNLMNLPRDTEANEWAGYIKKMFVPRPGYVFIESDLSQIELRVLAYYTKDPIMLELYRTGADLHKNTAAEALGINIEDVTYDQRQIGKTTNFSIAYLAGPATLYETLVFGDPRPEKVADMMDMLSIDTCASFIDAYFALYGYVRPWMDSVIDFARTNGYVETYWGRERRITGITDSEPGIRKHGENQAVNSIIQGSACDITNRAFMRCGRELDRRIAYPLLHIHDQLLLEAKEEEAEGVAGQVLEIMTDPCGELGQVVPIEADCAIIDRLGGNVLSEVA